MILSAAIGAYPHTEALRDGRVGSDMLRLDLAAISPISRAFAPMVRELRFDVSEMAIATFLQAKASGVALTLLPIVLAARFQQSALLCRDDSAIGGPADLVGRRIGIRAYSQTTGMWLRGILAEEHGVAPDQVRWTSFEDGHVRDIRDPPWVERAGPGQELLPMLKAGELDAIIVGNDVPNDPGLRTVFPDAAAAAALFWARHRLVPVNHMLTVRRDLAIDRPELVRELVRMFHAAAQQAPDGSPRLPDSPHPSDSRAVLRPAIELALRYTTDQGMLPRPVTLDEVWSDLPHLAP